MHPRFLRQFLTIFEYSFACERPVARMRAPELGAGAKAGQARPHGCRDGELRVEEYHYQPPYTGVPISSVHIPTLNSPKYITNNALFFQPLEVLDNDFTAPREQVIELGTGDDQGTVVNDKSSLGTEAEFDDYFEYLKSMIAAQEQGTAKFKCTGQDECLLCRSL